MGRAVWPRHWFRHDSGSESAAAFERSPTMLSHLGGCVHHQLRGSGRGRSHRRCCVGSVGKSSPGICADRPECHGGFGVGLGAASNARAYLTPTRASLPCCGLDDVTLFVSPQMWGVMLLVAMVGLTGGAIRA